MKTALLTSMAAVGFWLAAVSTQGQGTLNFASNTSPTPCITTNIVTGATARISPGNFVFGLYMGTTTNALVSSVTPILIVTNTGVLPGFISGSTFTLSGFAPGTTLIFEVKGWSLSSGAVTYETAFESGVQGVLGAVSQIGSITLGGSVGTPPSIFGSSGGAVPDPVFIISPEPSTVAVGGLGVAALAFFRRRK